MFSQTHLKEHLNTTVDSLNYKSGPINRQKAKSKCGGQAFSGGFFSARTGGNKPNYTSKGLHASQMQGMPKVVPDLGVTSPSVLQMKNKIEKYSGAHKSNFQK